MAFNPKEERDKYNSFSYEFVLSPYEGVPSCFIISCEKEPLLVPIHSLDKVKIIVDWLNEVNKYKCLEEKNREKDGEGDNSDYND